MCLKHLQLLGAMWLALLPVSALGAPPKQGGISPNGPVIILGDSAVPLTGPWKFSPGDSPWRGDSPLWAEPGFDDSRWPTLDLTPQADSFDLASSDQSRAPGWTAKGFPDLTGYAWYRMSIRVSDPSRQLSLKMPTDFDDAYQVYANGRFVGQFGRFDSSSPTLFFARPVTFALLPSTSAGQIDLALRFYMSPNPNLHSAGAGGMRSPPVLGLPLTAGLIQSSQEVSFAFGRFGRLLTMLLFLLMAPGVLWAWFENRRQLTFLWLFISLVSTVLYNYLDFISGATLLLTRNEPMFWLLVVLGPVWLPTWIMVWWSWFALRNRRWIPIAAWLTAPLTAFADYDAFLAARLPASLPSMTRASYIHASLLIVVIACILLLVVLIEGYRRDPTEALLAAVPIGLLELAALFSYFTPMFGLPFPALHFFGLAIDDSSIASILLALVLGALFLRRFLRDRVHDELSRQSLRSELEQARELQQRVLVPEDLHSPHFAVEAEYRPAQIVGGDFFVNIIGRDGSLCVVIGDVSGKGISAAMLVAVLVGAARTRAAQDFDPITMLKTLDDRLGGRSGGHFATCLAAHLFPNGVLRLANAGHIPPYLNGCELDIEGSMPLGIAGQCNPTKTQFQLRQGDILTFITDGVIEAKNKRGELLGFDQARVLSQKPPADVVSEVLAYGQDDDITVVRVTFLRSEAIGPSANLAARQPAPA